MIKTIVIIAGIVLLALIVYGYAVPVSTLNFCSNEEMQHNIQVLSGIWTTSKDSDGNCMLVGTRIGNRQAEVAINQLKSIGAITISPTGTMPNDLTLSIGPSYNFQFRKSVTQWENGCALGAAAYYDASFYYAGMPGNFNGANGCVSNQGNSNTPYPLTLRKNALNEETPVWGAVFGMPRTDPDMYIGDIWLRTGGRLDYLTKTPISGQIRISTKSEVKINNIKLYCQTLDFACDLQTLPNIT